MPRQVFSFDPPERFVVGTVGQPGERAFFLQATGGGRVVTVAVEKVQAQLLAERLNLVLDEARRRGADVPAVAPAELDDLAPLDQPIIEDFRVGTLTISFDEDELIVVQAEAVEPVEAAETEPDDEDDDEAEIEVEVEATGPVLRVRMSPAVARAFVKRTLRVVAAGRPPCPLCGLPVDPEGHVCPRQNGHRH